MESSDSKPVIIYDPIFLEHDTGDHPECAQRLLHTLATLRSSGLADQLDLVAPEPVPARWLLGVHTAAHVRAIERLCASGGGLLSLDPTVASAKSYEAALFAAGAGLLAVDLLFSPDPRPSFALVRPPGHHATAAEAMGFCLFNNVAVAAKYARDRWQVSRVVIVDFDVHHGNGTQDIFYADGNVLYISTHQSPLYPGTGGVDEVGVGAGAGATINLPLPPGTGDEGYRRAFAEVVIPAAERFAPDILLVSAGYDGHWRDPLASMNLSVAGYGALAEMLVQAAGRFCGGRIAFVLEGGYFMEALGFGVAATLAALLGQGVVDPLGPAPASAGRSNQPGVIATARRIHGL